MIERDIFKKKLDEGGEKTYVDMGHDTDGFGGEEILQGGKTKLRTREKDFVCGDEIEKKEVPVIKDKL